MHTPLPWAEHPLYENAEVHTIKRDDGTTFDSLDMEMASGDRLIATVRMTAGGRGIPCVDNEQECRDNFALIIKAVNAHDALMAALESVINCTASGLSDTRKEVMRNAAAILQKAKE